MKKNGFIISLVFILIIIPSLLFSITIEEIKLLTENSIEKSIMLPKIPIYIQGNHIKLKSTKFKEIINQEDSFYTITITHTGTNYKKKYSETLKRNVILFSIFGFLIGALIDLDVHEDSYNVDQEVYSEPFRITYTSLLTGVAALFGWQISDADLIPVSKDYLLKLSLNNKLIETKKCKIGCSSKITSKIIENLLNNSDINIKRYNELNQLYSSFIKPYNFIQIEELYNKRFSKLGNKKSEFETTPQYSDRIRKEQIRKKELQAEMEQETSIAKEKWEIEKFALLQIIKKDVSEIEFTKSYDFELLNYNADKQYYTFNISGIEKKVILPLMKAPKFKENISDYKIQKTFRPTLYGTWEIVQDDYVLINTKTDEIIPWEGSIPTYVEASVENPPTLSASVKLIEPSGEGYLDASEIATLKVTLSNSGKGPAKITRISLFQEDGHTLYYDVSNTIDEILPNKSVTTEFKISVPENIESGNVEFKISFLEEQGFEPVPLFFTAQTRAMLKPDIQIVDFGVVDANGDGKISKGETADIILRFQNIGKGKAKQVVTDVSENRIENVFIISDKHLELGDLESGESKDVTFTISTTNRVSEIVNLQVNISELRPQFSFKDNIILEIEKTQKQLEQIVFSGKDIVKKIEYSDDLSIDIEQNIPESNKSNKKSLAIIFGIEDYRNVSNVNFAFRDATIMKEYFSKTLGIPEEQIYFRANDEVTLGEFRKIFSKNGWLDKRVIENETDISFYYAGHGAPAIKEEKAFLIPFDGDPNYPVQTGYSLETVFENLSKLNANSVTVFLDACFTGANRENEMLLADARPVSIQLKNNYFNNVTVFSATSNNEISSSFPKNKHGLFSYFLMKGMQGEADSNKDNKLTINELFDYTKKNVSRIAGTLDREQTPQLECLEPEKIIINY